jgi:hypothetical protein
MVEGEVAPFAWAVSEGGTVNYDTHGDGSGQNISYKKGRSVAADDGQLQAAFTGQHGWFWRDRGDVPVSLTARTSGTYTAIKRLVSVRWRRVRCAATDARGVDIPDDCYAIGTS